MDLIATETTQLIKISLQLITIIFDKLHCVIVYWYEQSHHISYIIETEQFYFLSTEELPTNGGVVLLVKPLSLTFIKIINKINTEIVPNTRIKTL